MSFCLHLHQVYLLHLIECPGGPANQILLIKGKRNAKGMRSGHKTIPQTFSWLAHLTVTPDAK